MMTLPQKLDQFSVDGSAGNTNISLVQFFGDVSYSRILIKFGTKFVRRTLNAGSVWSLMKLVKRTAARNGGAC